MAPDDQRRPLVGVVVPFGWQYTWPTVIFALITTRRAEASGHAHPSAEVQQRPIRLCQCVELALKFRSTSDINAHGKRIRKLSAPTCTLRPEY